MRIDDKARRQFLVTGLLTSLPLHTTGQTTYPSRPITMIVPFAAGNVTDSIARLIGDRLSAALGQAVIVENRSGASGAIGMSDLARAPADGYTVGMSAIGPMALNPALYSKLAYDPYNGYSILSLVYKGPSLILVRADSPISSLADLIRRSQAASDGMDFATAGVGSSMHLTGELLAQTFGAKLRHVPNRGSGGAAMLLLSNEVPVLIDSATAGLNYVQSGRMRALAVTSAQRLKALPGVPTLAEAGYPGLVVDGWLCLLAPLGIPPAVAVRLTDEVRKVMQATQIQEQISALGGVAVSTSAEDSAAFIKAEQKRWRSLIQSAGITLN